MRKTNEMLNTFMPQPEKDWEAKLFIDQAIKAQAEYALECVARALSGAYDIQLEYKTQDEPFEDTEHIKGDDGSWIQKTGKYKLRAKMREFTFYGNKPIDLWVKIIHFWTVNQTIMPCGGAQYKNG